MLYLLAAIGAVAIAILVWRAFTRDGMGAPAPARSGTRKLAPDDDPEFLRRLDERNRDGEG